MKRDKEWLKEKLNTEKYYRETSELKAKTTYGELYDRGIRDGISVALEFIEQLDEPEFKQLDKKIKELDSYNDELIRDNNQLRNELDSQEVLSQEWIDENKYNHYIGRPFVYVDDLQNLIVPKQDKPIIPKFVADFIEKWKYEGLTIYEWFSFGNNDVDEDVNKWLYNNLNEKNRRREYLLIDAIRFGYEVEKEPVYFAKIKGHELIQRIPTFDEDTGENVSEYYRCVYFVLQSDGDLIVDMKDSGLSGAKHIMTMSQWNDLGINEANADFEEVN